MTSGSGIVRLFLLRCSYSSEEKVKAKDLGVSPADTPIGGSFGGIWIKVPPEEAPPLKSLLAVPLVRLFHRCFLAMAMIASLVVGSLLPSAESALAYNLRGMPVGIFIGILQCSQRRLQYCGRGRDWQLE